MGCRILKEERNYILQMIKKIRASGANVLLIQKSILRDAVTDLSLHYLVSVVPACCFTELKDSRGMSCETCAAHHRYSKDEARGMCSYTVQCNAVHV